MSSEKTFVYHDEKNLGQLYILGKMQDGSEEEKSYLINLIASAIRREYYDYPERKPTQAFKVSLQKANIILERFTNKKLNFICAVLCQGKLYLAQTKNNYFSNINQTKFEQVQEKVADFDVPVTQAEQASLMARFFNMPRFQKALIAFYLIFIFILASSALSSRNQTQEKPIINYQNLFGQAQQKILQAEAVLVFDQSDRAKALLQEAQNIINPAPSSPEKTKLEQDIKKQINKSNKLLETSILKTINLPKQMQGLVKIQKDIYSFDAQNTIYRGAKKSSTSSINLGYLQKATMFEQEDVIIFLTDTPSLAIYTPGKKKLEKVQARLPSALIKDVSSYSKYIYLLTKNQIYRYSRTLAGFSGPHSWLKQKTEFENPVSLAIDGDIYVLDNNKILKFYRGVREEFNLNFELENPIKIFTLPNLNYLYILKKNKVLVFNKSGKLVSQYINNKFTDLQDIWVSKDKIIYLLNNQEILEFTLTQR